MRELLDSIAGDVAFGWRALRRAPGFTAVSVATLALGIGATSAIFSVVSAVLLRPLPFADANRVVHIGETRRAAPGIGGTTSSPNFDDWRRASRRRRRLRSSRAALSYVPPCRAAGRSLGSPS